MGSCTNLSVLERYMSKNEERILKEYSHLIGEKVISTGETYVDYWIQNDVTFSNGTCYTTHFRWASEEENECGEENAYLTPEHTDYNVPFEEYLRDNILNKEVVSISLSTCDHDDMVYVCAEVGNGDYVQIPYINIDEIE